MLKPGKVLIGELEKVFWGDPFEISDDSKIQVDRTAKVVEDVINGKDAVYGINTGFGKLASVKIAKKDTATLQRNLILSHSAGVGHEIDDDIVRLIMALKVISLARGASGVRWELIELLIKMVNLRILPIIPSQGSVGASGDLAPLAHMALSLIGEGQVRYQGDLMSSEDAFQRNNLVQLCWVPKKVWHS